MFSGSVSQCVDVKFFKVRPRSGEGWANFVISYDKNSSKNLGISVISDYGNFSCELSVPAENYYSFLLDMNKSNVIKRFFGDKQYIYSSSKTKEEISERIAAYFKENPEEYSEDLFNDIVSDFTDEYTVFNKDVCHHILYNHKDFEKYFYDYENLPSGAVLNPVVNDFWDNCWQPLMAHIKEHSDKF